MEPISRKKTSVSPYNKKETPESPPSEIPAPEPISKPITGNTVLAPEPSKSDSQITSKADEVLTIRHLLISCLQEHIQIQKIHQI